MTKSINWRRGEAGVQRRISQRTQAAAAADAVLMIPKQPTDRPTTEHRGHINFLLKTLACPEHVRKTMPTGCRRL